MKYKPSYFYNRTPDWKKRKDPIIVRCIYRPLSYLLCTFLAEFNIKPNVVSFASIILAPISCFLYFLDSYKINILAAVLLNVWLLLDCVDGDLARGVGGQPFGNFLDGVGCYVLTAFLYFSLGISIFYNGGLLFLKGDIIVVIIGAMTSIIDILMRLIHHKYKEEAAKIKLVTTENQDSIPKITVKDRMLETIGVGGVLPLIILFCTIFSVNDIPLLLMFVVNICGIIWCIYTYVIKTLIIKDEND